MSSQRFPGIELTEWRSRLLDRHPLLFPDAEPIRTETSWALSSSGWPAVPDGWRRVVEDACLAIEEVAAREPSAEIAIADMKEKYGTLRLLVSTVGLSGDAGEEMRLAVDLAEARSGHVCQTCGERGRRWDDSGWLSTLCDVHGLGTPLREGQHHGVEITTRISAGKIFQSARRYEPDLHRFVAVPVPEEDQG